MKNISISLTITGLFGLVGVSIYTGINLSRIIPLLSIISFFSYLFLVGIIFVLSKYILSRKIFFVSFFLLLISYMFSIINFNETISTENSIKIQLAIIIISFILMIFSAIKGILKFIYK
jgi:hypothetical protein